MIDPYKSSFEEVKEVTRIYTEKDLERDIAMNPGMYKPIWQYHLQQMVLAPDPLAYLHESTRSAISIFNEP